MEEKPLLFVDSINIIKHVSSNQSVYDSRIKKDVKYIDKLDLLYDLMKIGKRVLCEFRVDDSYYEGFIISLDNKEVVVESLMGKEFRLPKSDIKKVNILKI